MLKRENVRISSWSINVDIVSEGFSIYLREQGFEGTKKIILEENRISDETRKDVISILRIAQECNANLLEVRSYTKQQVLRFSFEFKFREDFLEFENKIRELAL